MFCDFSALFLSKGGKSIGLWRHNVRNLGPVNQITEEPVNPELLEHLLDEHLAALELYAAQWTHAPEDSVQEAFIELAQQAMLPERIVPWLYRVVRNRAISMARSAGRRRRHELSTGESAPKYFKPSSGYLIDPAAAAAALGDLPGTQREIIVARIWGGLTLADAAQVAGVSTSTSQRRYEAGMKTLRERLGLKWLTEDNQKNRFPAS